MDRFLRRSTRPPCLFAFRSPRRPRSFGALTWLALIHLGSLGCDHPPSHVAVEERALDAEASAPVVSLPEPPSADDFVIEEFNDDKTLRVQGLIENKAKYMKQGEAPQEVVLTGRIVRLSPPCDPAKTKKSGESCPELHLVIEDDEQDPQKQLLVVGYREDFLKRAKIAEGEVHRFKGMYKMMGWGFTSSEDGLLELSEMDDVSVIETR